MGRWSWAKNQPSQPQRIPRGATELKWPVRVVLREAEVARPFHSCLNQLLDIGGSLQPRRSLQGLTAEGCPLAVP